MSFKVKELIIADLYRYQGRVSLLLFIRSLLFNKGFKYFFWIRLSKAMNNMAIIKWLPRLMHYYYKRIYCCDIGFRHEISAGICFYHVYNCAFADGVVLGKNVTLTHGVTLGHVNGVTPIIGDNVYLGPGCCVLGPVVVGNNVVIGANAVVTKDVPDNAIIVGNPGKIISYNGSSTTLKHPYIKEL